MDPTNNTNKRIRSAPLAEEEDDRRISIANMECVPFQNYPTLFPYQVDAQEERAQAFHGADGGESSDEAQQLLAGPNISFASDQDSTELLDHEPAPSEAEESIVFWDREDTQQYLSTDCDSDADSSDEEEEGAGESMPSSSMECGTPFFQADWLSQPVPHQFPAENNASAESNDATSKAKHSEGANGGMKKANSIATCTRLVPPEPHMKRVDAAITAMTESRSVCGNLVAEGHAKKEEVGTHSSDVAEAAAMRANQSIASASWDDVPTYSKEETPMTQEERKSIAKRRGICVQCGSKTHYISVFKRTPITNGNVHKGICIRCNPTRVPAKIFQEWEQHNQVREAIQSNETSPSSSFSEPNVPPLMSLLSKHVPPLKASNQGRAEKAATPVTTACPTKGAIRFTGVGGEGERLTTAPLGTVAQRPGYRLQHADLRGGTAIEDAEVVEAMPTAEPVQAIRVCNLEHCSRRSSRFGSLMCPLKLLRRKKKNNTPQGAVDAAVLAAQAAARAAEAAAQAAEAASRAAEAASRAAEAATAAAAAVHQDNHDGLPYSNLVGPATRGSRRSFRRRLQAL